MSSLWTNKRRGSLAKTYLFGVGKDYYHVVLAILYDED